LYTIFNADQSERLYSAVTYVWLLNEICWILTNFVYPARFDLQIDLIAKCMSFLADQKHTTLLDELDQCTVFRPMYHHLLPLYGISLADQSVAQLPFTFAYEFTKDVGHTSRYGLPSLHKQITRPTSNTSLIIHSC
jgi:hypothetical protein